MATRDDGPPTSKGEYTPDRNTARASEQRKHKVQELGPIGPPKIRRKQIGITQKQIGNNQTGILKRKRELEYLIQDLKALHKLGKASKQNKKYLEDLKHLNSKITHGMSIPETIEYQRSMIYILDTFISELKTIIRTIKEEDKNEQILTAKARYLRF